MATTQERGIEADGLPRSWYFAAIVCLNPNFYGQGEKCNRNGGTRRHAKPGDGLRAKGRMGADSAATRALIPRKNQNTGSTIRLAPKKAPTNVTTIAIKKKSSKRDRFRQKMRPRRTRNIKVNGAPNINR